MATIRESDRSMGRRAVLQRGAAYGAIAPALYLLHVRRSAAQTALRQNQIASDPACFRRGTRITTSTGEVVVERLAAGDFVVTPTGLRPVKWIGKRSFHRAPGRTWQPGVAPVRIAAGALADNNPSRDLFVSPEHKLLLDGVLVAARDLLNGRTITHSLRDNETTVSYFHIELDRHDAVLAEGAWAETFQVAGSNRERFSNFATARVESPMEQALYAPVVGFSGLKSVARYALTSMTGRRSPSDAAFRAIRARVNARHSMPV